MGTTLRLESIEVNRHEGLAVGYLVKFRVVTDRIFDIPITIKNGEADAATVVEVARTKLQRLIAALGEKARDPLP